jgi:transcriptional regulator with XRE-family HTH domain
MLPKDNKKKKAIQLRKNGLKVKEIAEILSVSAGSISNWLQNIPEHHALIEKHKLKRRESKELRKKEKDANKKVYSYIYKDDGYIYHYKPGHPRAQRRPYIAEHVLVMEKHLGRFLNRDEVVHHKDGDKSNNNIDNLEILTKAEHNKIHNGGKAKTIRITCAYCGKKVLKKYRQVGTKIKNGQKDFYCNRSCMGKHFGYRRSKC